VEFKDLLPSAEVLTILDVCNAPHAIASLQGVYPYHDPKLFRTKFKKRMLKSLSIPAVCDGANSTWAFRIGRVGQHKTQPVAQKPQRNDFEGMSLPIGDSVVACLLAAVKAFLDLGCVGNLDDLFRSKYMNLNLQFIVKEADALHPVSQLEEIQNLIADGILPVRREAFKCVMFERQDEWFLTMERALELTEGQEKLADLVTNYVIKHVSEWHEANPRSYTLDEEAEQCWFKILALLGPFARRIKAVQLDTEGKSVVQTADGTQMESWATSCCTMPDCLRGVKRTIEEGLGLDDSDDS
jgi:hypothetical protein